MVHLKDKVLVPAGEDMGDIEGDVDHAGSKAKKRHSVACFLKGICKHCKENPPMY